ncbi:MAG: hypothetical protein WKF71_02145 [Pyrinomonadaceae bacterium]
MTKIITVVFALASIFVLQLSCSPKSTVDDRINVMSPDVNGSLVFFFKKETTSEEIFEFQRTVIGIPNPNNNTGYASLPGIMTGVGIRLNGFTGESINFQPSSTEAEKSFVKKRVSESPLVYKVYENVTPSQIKDL